MIKIDIPKSTSVNFPKAIKAAKKIGDISWQGDEKKSGFSIRMDFQTYANSTAVVDQLVGIAGGWKGFEIYIDDIVVPKAEVHALSEVAFCCNSRNKSMVPSTHCNRGEKISWGCKFLSGVDLHLPEYSYFRHIGEYRYWYQFGCFNEDLSEWTINKPMLKEAVDRNAEFSKGNLCPYFTNQVDLALESLPDIIPLGSDSAWEIVYEEDAFGTQVSKAALEIAPKLEGNSMRGPVGLSISIGDDKDDREGATERRVPDISFDDVGGIDDIISQVREVIELPLKHPELIKHLGIRPHKGVLLYGQPGCGKTLIAKAIANEISAHFISIRGPELLSKWVGASEENLRKVFEEAEAFAPSIIFFDEIDSIARERSGDESGANMAPVVNQLLTLMDGMKSYDNVCVIASTNRPDILDSAVKRPGRFDYMLEVTKPTREGCFKILQIHSEKMPIASDVNFGHIASRLYELEATGASIAFLAREAAYSCLRRNFNTSTLIATSPDLLEYSQIKIEATDFESAFKNLHN